MLVVVLLQKVEFVACADSSGACVVTIGFVYSRSTYSLALSMVLQNKANGYITR